MAAMKDLGTFALLLLSFVLGICDAYEVCETYSSGLYTYCTDGKYCCHNNKDCCTYTGSIGLIVGLPIGAIIGIVALIVFCCVRRRRRLAMTQRQGIQNPTVFVSQAAYATPAQNPGTGQFGAAPPPYPAAQQPPAYPAYPAAQQPAQGQQYGQQQPTYPGK